MSQQVNDPLDIVEEPEAAPKAYFGETFLTHNKLYWDRDARQWADFDPRQHRASDKINQVILNTICTRRDGTTFDVNREDKIEWPPSPWATIANKSLRALGVHYTELEKGRWCKFELIKTGESYPSKTTGEMIENDFYSFLEFYSDEDTCRQAEAAFYGRAPVEPEPDLDETMPMPEDTPADNGAERVAMAQFLPGLWDQYKPNADAFYAAIASNPMVAVHFSSNSPEVIEIVEGAA